MKKAMIVAILALGLVLMSMPAFSTPLSVFDGWIQIAAEDGVGDYGFVGPGYGGQAFDAEYLFYKYDKVTQTLSIGLQTGFDVVTGAQAYPISSDTMYYAGDLALSFDDCGANGWEYGVEFGFLEQESYSGTSIGFMDAGLYSVTTWNNEVYDYYSASAPFAIASGTLVTELTNNNNVSGKIGDSYFRTVSFVVPVGMDIQNIAAHWTMSCGNDVIEGCAPVPEPQTLLLMGIGLLGLAFVGRKKLGDRS